MSNRTKVTCEDCYFRRAGLCALQVEVVCPTFRLHSKGTMVTPRQPRLVPRLANLSAAAAAVAAA